MEVSVPEAAWPDGAQIRMRDIDGQLIAVGYFAASSATLHPRVVIAEEK
jgi:hypothetical protein